MRRALPSILLLTAVLCAVPEESLAAKGRGRTAYCSVTAKGKKAPYLAVFSAFPAEVAPLVAVADVEKTVEIGGRPFYIGRIGRVRVVLGLLGIGLVNAENTTRAVLDNPDYPIAGVIVSGVAGSNHRIAEVVIAEDWVQGGIPGVTQTNVAMMALMRRAQNALPEPLEKCTRVPPTSPSGAFICMPFDPQLLVGGHGQSDDPYNGAAPCGTGDILGCDLPPVPTALLASPENRGGTAKDYPEVVDMETAAVARLAVERDVPFLGVRAASDGAGDPLGFRPFPLQFFDYYVLAARNAAIVTRGLLGAVEDLSKTKAGRKACKLLKKHKWDRAAEKLAQ